VSKTNFEKVVEFHELGGFTSPVKSILPDVSEMRLGFRLIDEEREELEEGYLNEDLENFAKELADLLYVVYRVAFSASIDIDRVFNEVHRSNMSKFCSKQDALDTKEAHLDKGVPCYIEGLQDGCSTEILHAVKRTEDGKILKNIYMSEAVVEPLLTK